MYGYQIDEETRELLGAPAACFGCLERGSVEQGHSQCTVRDELLAAFRRGKIAPSYEDGIWKWFVGPRESPKNIHIYWDGSRGIVGLCFHVGGAELRHEEPDNGRRRLTDDEILGMVDAAIGAACSDN